MSLCDNGLHYPLLGVYCTQSMQVVVFAEFILFSIP